MSLRLRVVAFVSAVATVCTAKDLLINGDFEQDLGIGWTQSAHPVTNSTIDRDTVYNPDPDYEAGIYRFDSYYAKLAQEVAVPDLNLAFSYSTRLTARDLGAWAGYWAAASICLTYKDAVGDQHGQTYITFKTPNCPWTNTPVQHLIVLSDSGWHTGSLNIASELANLPGVNPAAITSIEVAALDTTNGC